MTNKCTGDIIYSNWYTKYVCMLPISLKHDIMHIKTCILSSKIVWYKLYIEIGVYRLRRQSKVCQLKRYRLFSESSYARFRKIYGKNSIKKIMFSDLSENTSN